MIQSLGALSIAISWLAGAYLLTKWRGTHDMSISLHAASNRTAYFLFASVLTLGGALLSLFIFRWYIPHLDLGMSFSSLFILAYAAQIVTAWVPDQTGWRSWRARSHKIAAYTMAILFMPMSFYIVFSSQISGLARAVSILCLTYMVISISIVPLFRRTRAKYLIYQSLYVVAFQVIILATAYLS